MGILSWIILGLIAGWIAKFFMPLGQVGVLKTILLGVAGALVVVTLVHSSVGEV